jgi:iron complex transport system ATP-binding protein
VLLLDEPTAHLDLKHQLIVLGHLQRLALAESRAVVVALHDLHLAARFATHALLLGPDGAASHGPAAEVMDDAALSASFGVPVTRTRCDDGRWLYRID